MNSLFRDWQRHLGLNAPPVESTARCPECPAVFAAPTELEAAKQLSRHMVFRHDSPPA